MATICLTSGHEHIGSNCLPNMRSSTGAPGEATWTPAIRKKVAALLRAHKFGVVEADANVNCGAHPRYDLTLAIHYQSNTGHSGFGVFVADKTFDQELGTSIKRARAIAKVYAARTKLPNYSSPVLGLNRATWENDNTLFYYAWFYQKGPLALIECGEGADGAPDHTFLYYHQDAVAAAIAEGVCAAFGVTFVNPAVAVAQATAAQAAEAAKAAQAAAEAAATFEADAAKRKAAEEAAAVAAKAAAEAAHQAAAEVAASAPLPTTWQQLGDLLRALLQLLLRR